MAFVELPMASLNWGLKQDGGVLESLMFGAAAPGALCRPIRKINVNTLTQTSLN